MRYARLVWLMFRVSLQNDAAYRADFFLQLAASLVHLAALLLGQYVIFQNTPDVNGWGPWEMLVLVGVFRVVSGVIGLFVAPNMRMIMEDVRTGKLDFLLLRPVNSQFHASVRRISIWKGIDILLGLGLAVTGAVKLTGTVPLLPLLLFIAALVTATMICYSIWLVLATLSFWLVRVQNIEMVFWNLFEAVRYPISIYGRGVQWLLTYVFPAVFIVHVPAQSLIGGAAGVESLSLTMWIAAVILGPAWLVAATLVWRYGLKHYSGASA